MSEMKLLSPAFENNGRIPPKYTCDGSDMNPELRIENVPASARSLALIMDDPDAPGRTFVHWVVWNIDPATRLIRENSAPEGAAQGVTDFRKKAYGGPCPPPGVHRYFFKLYALDCELGIGSSSSRTDLETAMKGHILAQAQLIGLYGRR